MGTYSYRPPHVEVFPSASAPSLSKSKDELPIDGADDLLLHSPPKRVRTWASVRSFFLLRTSPDCTQQLEPDPVIYGQNPQQLQLQLQQQAISLRARKRSSSTSNSIRSPGQVSSHNLVSKKSLRDTISTPATVPAITGEAAMSLGPSPLPPLSTSIPSVSSKSSELSWFRRMFFIRVIFLLLSWLSVFWEGLTRPLRLECDAKGKGIERIGMDTESNGDEKESRIDESRINQEVRHKTKSEKSSRIFPTSRSQRTKPPTPSPLSQSNIISPPIVNLIPPDPLIGDKTNDERQSVVSLNPSLTAAAYASSLSPQASSQRVVQSSIIRPSSPAKITPLHTRKTLVLDLDETLIHSTTRPLFASTGGSGLLGLGNLFGFGSNKKAGHMVEVVMNGRSTLYHVYKRPFVDYFLRKVSTWYTLVIFTASMREYADPVIDWLDAGRGILELRFFREHCTQLPNGTYSKDLTILNEDLARICLIDNSPVSYSINKANGIPIEGWTNDQSDEALLDLLPVLDSLRFTSDVRHVLGLRGF
ncbi:NIF-domain-containing [Pyrrhoderma noxium]|uniref:NIF-domain-containing n=1 Tax=Pyrrhoderma noxium TaxID=2282107 RepID=A0A286UMV8_9AGAM|nr:NIF-domain-containing [Pyrrhoderma noxium]